MRQRDITIPFMVEGIVVATNDDDQMGRLKVFIPSVDGEKPDAEKLPWAEYVGPFNGVVNDMIVGRERQKRTGMFAYGFWAIPKINSIVAVMFLNGDSKRRFVIGGIPALHANRGLPQGRNVDESNAVGPWTDTYDPATPAYENLRAHFSNNTSASEAQTRGFYERQVAQSKTTKDGSEGYAKNPNDTKNLDSQVYCMVTPGGHYLTMVDDPEHCRMRMRTTAGNQIILDDSNERIYVSTARGGTWIELDEDGHLHAYAAESMSFSSGADINFIAKNKFNVSAGTGINLMSPEDINIDTDANFNLSVGQNIKITSCATLHMIGKESVKISSDGLLSIKSGADIKVSASGGFGAKAGGDIKVSASGGFGAKAGGDVKIGAGGTANVAGSGGVLVSGSKINLNGPAAARPDDAEDAEDPEEAGAASSPSILPAHEPWTRPVANITRNSNWKA